ncbi:MAG: AbgT family transporter [Bacilli bacterium]
MKKKKKKFFQGALSTILIMCVIVMFLSFIFSLFGFEGYETYISNNTLESSLVTVNNIFSVNGFKYIFTNSITNFKLFEPLVLLIISLVGISIADTSGMLDPVFLPLRKIKGSFLSFIVILLGVCITFFGNFSYVILFPLIALLYKKIGRSPILGILTVFLGITLGYGTGIMFNYDSYVLGSLTQASAIVEVDKDYTFSLVSTEYIMVISTFIISIILTHLVDKKISVYFKKHEVVNSDNKFSYPVFVLFGVLLLILVYMIIPGLPFSGLLLDSGSVRYIDKLFGSNSPFANSFVCIYSLILSICGLFYGYLNGIRTSDVYTKGISKTFDGLGYLFVLMFFASQLQGLIEWTNVGTILGSRMIDFMSNLQLSGAFLIVIFFIIIVIMSILIPSTSTKWILASPVVVPLFMRSNITPDFTQFVFQVADSVGKGLTPVFAYFIVMIGFMQKYVGEDDRSVNMVDTLRMTLPVTLIIGLVWIAIVVLWFISGLPIGINGFSTL